jgi:hypothetical protein
MLNGLPGGPRAHSFRHLFQPLIATMSRCAACSTTNDAGLRFCGECGAKLPETCAACGFVNPPAFKYCGQCGSALAASRGAGPPTEAATPASLLEREGERRLERRAVSGQMTRVTGPRQVGVLPFRTSAPANTQLER